MEIDEEPQTHEGRMEALAERQAVASERLAVYAFVWSLLVAVGLVVWLIAALN